VFHSCCTVRSPSLSEPLVAVLSMNKQEFSRLEVRLPAEVRTLALSIVRFLVRIRIGVPPGGLGQRHTQITAWLDENCGADGWAMTPSGTRGVLNEALSIYFAYATLVNAFVNRWRVAPGPRRQAASSRPVTMTRTHGSASGRINHVEGGELLPVSGTRDHPRTVMGSVWKPRRRPKCAFSGWYWRERLL